MPSTILARADALMRRTRQNTEDSDDIPVLTDSVDPVETEDDIPVLLDIADFAPPTGIIEPAATEPSALAEQPEEPSPSVAEEPVPPPAFDNALRDIIAHELARRVEQRLTDELPRIIEAAVRDFLAEQRNIDALQPHD